MCSNCVQGLFVLLLFCNYRYAGCNPITNTNNNFNDHLRRYEVKENNANLTHVKTLQKEEQGRYANFAPVSTAVRFKEVPDSALSSSSYSRGLLHHEHSGYGLIDYEDAGHYGYGLDYHDHHDHHDPHDHHDFGHHGGHHDLGNHHHGGHGYGHGYGYGHHHKHYDHALAAKTILWPIAGIALLGAAAALVTNPVLLQLGVVSGKRRRRDTEEVTGPDFNVDFKNYPIDALKSDNEDILKINNKNVFKKKMLKEVKKSYTRKVDSIPHGSKYANLDTPVKYAKNVNDDKFVPVPLKVKRD